MGRESQRESGAEREKERGDNALSIDDIDAPDLEADIAAGVEPVWMYVFAGWLLASTQLGAPAPRPTAEEIRSRMPAGTSTSAGDPDRMSARELRRLPAIGPARALAIVRERWEHGLRGGPEAWDTIPGIGPKTVEAIRRSLESEKAAPR